jgi:Glucose-6-phosphate isomerase
LHACRSTLEDPRDTALASTQTAIVQASRVAEKIRHAGINCLIHIGIGGSELGIRLAHDAFRAAGLTEKLALRFLSGLDPAEWRGGLAGLEPSRCAFVLASKSFTSQETLVLGERARAWLGRNANQRLYAVTAYPARAESWGILKEGTELEFVIMVIAVSCVKLLSAHNSTQHTSRKHKV